MTANHGPGDPGDENDHGKWHPRDGWPREGCTCEFCIELRSRPTGGITRELRTPDLSVEWLADEDALTAGMHAIGSYIKQQEVDGSDELLSAYSLSFFEQRGLTLLRAHLLRTAVEGEAFFQRLSLDGSGGQSGVL